MGQYASSEEIKAVLDTTSGGPHSTPDDTIEVRLRMSRAYVPIAQSLLQVMPTEQHSVPADRLVRLARTGMAHALRERERYRRSKGWVTGERESIPPQQTTPAPPDTVPSLATQVAQDGIEPPTLRTSTGSSTD